MLSYCTGANLNCWDDERHVKWVPDGEADWLPSLAFTRRVVTVDCSIHLGTCNLTFITIAYSSRCQLVCNGIWRRLLHISLSISLGMVRCYAFWRWGIHKTSPSRVTAIWTPLFLVMTLKQGKYSIICHQASTRGRRWAPPPFSMYPVERFACFAKYSFPASTVARLSRASPAVLRNLQAEVR